jgi:hypothetical protein
MDTLRDKLELDKLWDSNKAPWKVWDKNMSVSEEYNLSYFKNQLDLFKNRVNKPFINMSN